VSADNGGVQKQIFKVAVCAQVFKELFKDAAFAPSGKAFIDGVPVAVFSGQVAPLRSGSGYPENGFEEPANLAGQTQPDLGKSS
jgi:hypothetical protein